MPTPSGKATIRDWCPIFCQVCGTEILAGQLAEDGTYYHGESYEVIGLARLKDKSFISVYRHVPECPPHNSIRTDPVSVERKDARPTTKRRSKERYQTFSGVKPKRERPVVQLKIVPTSADEHVQPPKLSQEAVRQFLEEVRASQDEARNFVFFEGSPPIEYESKKPTEKEAVIDLVEETPITNEQAVIFSFGRIADNLGYTLLRMNNFYPDAVFLSPDGVKITVEFEYKSSNFIRHGHDPALTDLVVCMYEDSRLPVPILALADL
jgi:hypothetical protein